MRRETADDTKRDNSHERVVDINRGYRSTEIEYRTSDTRRGSAESTNRVEAKALKVSFYHVESIVFDIHLAPSKAPCSEYRSAHQSPKYSIE